MDELVDVNGVLYIIVRFWTYHDNGIEENQLWKNDGTGSGTTLVKQIDADWNLSFSSIHYLPSVYQGNLYFRAFTNATDIEIWRSNGTAQGTYLLKDINSARTANAYPDILTPVGNDLYFKAVTTAEGGELWKANGRPVQASLLKDVHPGPDHSAFNQIVGVNGTLFAILDYENELWRSNGDANNMVLVKKLLSGEVGLYSSELTAVGNVAYFLEQDYYTDPNITLWVSDGTEAGTQPLRKLTSECEPRAVAWQPDCYEWFALF